ncbi:MAG: sugar-transfer associated ATP-grasp domain-containing protein [Acidobacteriota bacterium]|nr:sugar-transfer associated ATP-grasp domain-containing protein [Acidobacteriota bacterium]
MRDARRRRHPNSWRLTFDEGLLLGLRPVRLLAGRARANWRWHGPLTARERLRAWRLGLLYQSYALYDLASHDPADFLKDHVDIDYFVSESSRGAIGDKLTLLLSMRATGVPTPTGLGYILHGRVHPLDTAGCPKMPVDWLEQSAELTAGFVLRPNAGGGGRGVHIFQPEGAGRYATAARSLSANELAAEMERLDGYLITRFVEQHAYARALHPPTPNTLRLLTIWDLETKRPYVAAAAQLVGRPGRGALSSFSGGVGGLSVEVDLSSGVLGRAVSLTGDGRRRSSDTHPDTGAPISGVEVPCWRRIADTVERAASVVPHSPYVGWDLLLDDASEVQMIEANPRPGVFAWQAHRPLLEDPRARRFFEHLGLA